MNPSGDNQVEKNLYKIRCICFFDEKRDINKHRPRKIDVVIKYCISVYTFIPMLLKQ